MDMKDLRILKASHPARYYATQSDFVDQMKRVYSSTGFINQPPPMFCGTAISLFDLYMMVTAKGGYDKIDLEAWREIGSNLLLSQIPAPSARVLKAIYHQYLLNFERTVNFTQLIQQAKPDMLRIERAPEPAPKKKKEAKEHALPQTQVLPPMAHLYKPAHPLLEIADSPGDLEVDDSSDPNQDYDVEAILGHAIDKVQKKTMYYVKWLGYANNLNQWIPEGNFTGDVLLAEYKKRISDRKKADAAKAAAVGTPDSQKPKPKAVPVNHSQSAVKEKKVSALPSVGTPSDGVKAAPVPPSSAPATVSTANVPKKRAASATVPDAPITAPTTQKPVQTATHKEIVERVVEPPPAKKAKTNTENIAPSATVFLIKREEWPSWCHESLDSIPQDILDLDNWDDLISRLVKIDNKGDEMNQVEDLYRTSLLWKDGVLAPEPKKLFIPAGITRRKCKDRLIEYFFSVSKFSRVVQQPVQK